MASLFELQVQEWLWKWVGITRMCSFFLSPIRRKKINQPSPVLKSFILHRLQPLHLQYLVTPNSPKETLKANIWKQRKSESLLWPITSRNLLASEYQNSLVFLLLVKVSRLSWVDETADISGRVNRCIAHDGSKYLYSLTITPFWCCRYEGDKSVVFYSLLQQLQSCLSDTEFNFGGPEFLSFQ